MKTTQTFFVVIHFAKVRRVLMEAGFWFLASNRMSIWNLRTSGSIFWEVCCKQVFEASCFPWIFLAFLWNFDEILDNSWFFPRQYFAVSFSSVYQGEPKNAFYSNIVAIPCKLSKCCYQVWFQEYERFLQNFETFKNFRTVYALACLFNCTLFNRRKLIWWFSAFSSIQEYGFKVKLNIFQFENFNSSFRPKQI